MTKVSKKWAGLGVVAVLSACHAGQRGEQHLQLHPGDRLTSFAQEIASPIRSFKVNGGGSYSVPVTVKNTGTEPWFKTAGAGTVDLSYRWLDSNSLILPIEGKRTDLERSVLQPGDSEGLQLQVIAPPQPGSYILWVSMVQEGVDWFFSRGAMPLILHVTVT